MRALIAYLCFTALSSAALCAQTVLDRGPGVVRARLIDSATAEPVRRAKVCGAPAVGDTAAAGGSFCVSADTAGHFRFDSLPAGRRYLRLSCSPARGFLAEELGHRVVPVQAPGGQEAVLRVRASGCDQRPFEVLYGTWAGVYAYDFENSSFAACGDTARIMWVEFLKPPAYANWPKATADPRVFVRWRGTRIGPRMFADRYLLKVDSVFEVRPVSSRDCRE